MHIRTFQAANLQAALAEIREQMGPDASVLHTRQIRGGWMGWLGRSHVEVTAGLKEARDKHESQEPTSRFSVVSPPDFRFLGGEETNDYANESCEFEPDPILTSLLGAGVDADVAKRWIASADGFAAHVQDGSGRDASRYDVNGIEQGNREHLQRAVARELNLCGPIRTQPGDRHVVALVGPTGVGKTTTIAKLAAGFRIEARRRVGLVTIDTYRIAAVQQLKAYAEIMDLPMRVVETPEQMAPALQQLGDVDLVLIDTAGRSPRSDARVQQLAEFLRAAKPDETHLVLSATSSPDSIRSSLAGFAQVRATAVILTKLDETPHTAGVLSALTAADRSLATPLSYITHGQSVPDDIAVADATHLLASLLPGWNGAYLANEAA